MTGLRSMGNGNLKCLFCNHKSYKCYGDALTHVQNNHELELANATIEEMRGKLEQAENKPPKIEIREKVVYRDPPAKKEEYWYIKNGGGIYCETCKTVQMGVGIPEGQTIENTPHHCGNRTLKLVLAVSGG